VLRLLAVLLLLLLLQLVLLQLVLKHSLTAITVRLGELAARAMVVVLSHMQDSLGMYTQILDLLKAECTVTVLLLIVLHLLLLLLLLPSRACSLIQLLLLQLLLLQLLLLLLLQLLHPAVTQELVTLLCL
jgi:hypothetical protein